jgi:hypothetical protein
MLRTKVELISGILSFQDTSSNRNLVLVLLITSLWTITMRMFLVASLPPPTSGIGTATLSPTAPVCSSTLLRWPSSQPVIHVPYERQLFPSWLVHCVGLQFVGLKQVGHSWRPESLQVLRCVEANNIVIQCTRLIGWRRHFDHPILKADK